MGLFDIFTFKKEASRIFTKETFTNILEATKAKIIELIKENMPGIEKKLELDKYIRSKVSDLVVERNISNKVVLWLIFEIEDILPYVTQLVYDFLKEKVENL